MHFKAIYADISSSTKRRFLAADKLFWGNISENKLKYMWKYRNTVEHKSENAAHRSASGDTYFTCLSTGNMKHNKNDNGSLQRVFH